MQRTLVFEESYPHPREKVWAALTSSEAMADWLMPNNFAPRLGHQFQFRTKPAPGFDGIVHCEVLEIDPPKTLAFSWRGGGIDTTVRFTLTSVESGTHLRFEQSGFKGLRAMMVSFILGNGWRGKILPVGLPAAAARIDAEGSYTPADGRRNTH